MHVPNIHPLIFIAFFLLSYEWKCEGQIITYLHHDTISLWKAEIIESMI